MKIEIMLQRIQSFWLVLAACCMALCFMTPVATYQAQIETMQQTVQSELNLLPKGEVTLNEEQLLTLGSTIDYSQKMSGFKTWPLVVLAILVGAIALLSVFLYKNRVRQMRVVTVGFLLNVIYVFVLFFWAVDAYGKTMAQAMGCGDPKVTWLAGAYAPIVAIVFFVLAHRGIKKDEMKVRAADRLR